MLRELTFKLDQLMQAGQSRLSTITITLGNVGLVGRKSDCCENCYDRDYYYQLNKSEPLCCLQFIHLKILNSFLLNL